ncbi:hypothetical protein BASA81_018141 [Batrachochytrium salamandrivorans]|nr:hypothetical protein BASA81_018141 [Batrachochytrium salamandrivorans]
MSRVSVGQVVLWNPCSLCQFRPVPPVALPFERWGIDFYGPMAETKSGNKYLITCIDYATRWVLAKPMHAMLGHGLTTLVHRKRDRWDEYLPQVLLALFGLERHSVTGIFPVLSFVRHSSSSPN